MYLIGCAIIGAAVVGLHIWLRENKVLFFQGALVFILCRKYYWTVDLAFLHLEDQIFAREKHDANNSPDAAD